MATCTLPTSAGPCIGSLARAGGISIVTTAPKVDYKIRWPIMMSVPESRAVVGRYDGINGRDSMAAEFAAWLGLVPRHCGNGGGFACSESPSVGQVSPHPADPRCPRGAHQQQGATRMGVAIGRAPTGERGHCRDSQQDSTHDLGLVDPRPGVSTGLRQPANLSAATTDTRTNTGGGLRKVRQRVMANSQRSGLPRSEKPTCPGYRAASVSRAG